MLQKIFFIFILSFTLNAVSQNCTLKISGNIIDEHDKSNLDYANVYIQELFGTGIFLGIENGVLYMLLDDGRVKKVILKQSEINYISKIKHLELGQYITFKHVGWFDNPEKSLKVFKFIRHNNHAITTKSQIIALLTKPTKLELVKHSL